MRLSLQTEFFAIPEQCTRVDINGSVNGEICVSVVVKTPTLGELIIYFIERSTCAQMIELKYNRRYSRHKTGNTHVAAARASLDFFDDLFSAGLTEQNQILKAVPTQSLFELDRTSVPAMLQNMILDALNECDANLVTHPHCHQTKQIKAELLETASHLDSAKFWEMENGEIFALWHEVLNLTFYETYGTDYAVAPMRDSAARQDFKLAMTICKAVWDQIAKKMVGY